MSKGNPEKKRSFIKAWYKNECGELNFSDRLKLARVWTDICLNDEEYEMAAAIVEARDEMVKKHIRDKRKRRTLLQKIVTSLYLIKRKFRVWLKSK